MDRSRGAAVGRKAARPIGVLVPVVLASLLVMLGAGGASARPMAGPLRPSGTATSSGAVGNFTAVIDRLVELVGVAGSGLLALVWARVALSWFSNDVTKKIQAKDRARDALVGTLLFVGAVSGLVWGLAHWVVTGA